MSDNSSMVPLSAALPGGGSSAIPVRSRASPALVGFLAAWAAFWLLLGTVAIQDHLRHGQAALWQPLLWEGSSFLVASALVWRLWRRVPDFDHLLTQPIRWFGIALLALMPVAPSFVALVYGIRHAVYAGMGLHYAHDPWPIVFRYEMVKFAMFYLLFAAIFFGVRSYLAMNAQRLRAEQALAQTQQAQLLQLTQQIEPHFLFNALNTIAATIHTDPDLADELLTRLASLLRATTDLARRPMSSLDEELRLLDAYAAIMRQRFCGRLSLTFEVDPAALNCAVPTLLLQPLLENAFKHGVEAHPGAATIVVSAHRDRQRLRLTVSDDIGQLREPINWGTGLCNVRQRLSSLYGERAQLTLGARDPSGVIARIELPCES